MIVSVMVGVLFTEMIFKATIFTVMIYIVMGGVPFRTHADRSIAITSHDFLRTARLDTAWAVSMVRRCPACIS